MALKGSQSEGNLRAAFAREAQTHRRLHYFARRADIEGHAGIAELFRSLAEGESGHSFGHLEFLEEIGDPLSGKPLGDTAASLRAAIAGEAEEADTLYAEYAATARGEGLGELGEWFDSVGSAERVHVELLRRALEELEGA